MAHDRIEALGLEINDINAYNPVGGFSLVTSPTPSQGTYLLKVSGVGNGSSKLFHWPPYTGRAWLGSGAAAFSKTYRWQSVRDFAHDWTGTPTVGLTVAAIQFGSQAEAHADTNFNICTVNVDASTYQMRLRDAPGAAWLGSVFGSFTKGTLYAIRVETNGTTVKVWVNGTLYLTHSFTTQLGYSGIVYRSGNSGIAGNVLPSGHDLYFGPMYAGESNSETDRIGTSIARYRKDPDGDSSSALAKKLATACGGSADGTYTEWDDYVSGGSYNGSDGNKLCGADAGSEISTLSDPTIANPASAIARFHTRSGPDIGAKTVTWYHRLEDGSGNSEVTMPNLASARTCWSRFTSPPTGAWEDSGKMAALLAGVRSVGTNNDNDKHYSLAVEVITVDSDPPAGGVSADPGGAPVFASANAMRL